MSTIAPTHPLSPTTLAEVPLPQSTPPEPYRFTVDQYERMTQTGILTEDDRVELINGIVVTKMAKGPAHIWAAKQAEKRLEPLLGGAFSLRREAPARIPTLNEPEPDLVIARGRDSIYLARHPESNEIAMAIEVSDTTYRYDRTEKFHAYASGGIPVYWIVNLPRRQVEVYMDPSPEGYGSARNYLGGEAIPVIIDGQQLGLIAVDDILPPQAAMSVPEGNGA